MEDHLFETFSLEKGNRLLDAGCGIGHVAIHTAQRGLHFQGINVVDSTIEDAKRNIRKEDLESAITVRKTDYHHLDGFEDDTFEGAYIMETFVHATDPEAALHELFCTSSITAFADAKLKDTMEQTDKHTSMLSNTCSEEGVLAKILEEAGFKDVVVQNLTKHVTPMFRLLFALAYVPYLFVKLLGLESRFVNTMAGVEGNQGRKFWRYVAISARKS
ncbi:24-methylenesterol C-methyltransferase 3 [Hyphodiscus hymeniophilus]|uniref:24-methylenesterol C-methyltransferase 3 n=1 Tax=Hyphodiscus hymeniophilus TaxID=353542 RepID=A0A9P6VRD4_9HELO|nr:24-methylenesterol C-methyltransferase 3 [Hyphodiscus hymeniophilus]